MRFAATHSAAQADGAAPSQARAGLPRPRDVLRGHDPEPALDPRRRQRGPEFHRHLDRRPAHHLHSARPLRHGTLLALSAGGRHVPVDQARLRRLSRRSSPAGSTGPATCRTFPRCCTSRPATRSTSAGPAGTHGKRSPAYFIGFSFFGVGLALALNVVGLNIGKWLNNIGSQGTWIPVALLCAVAVVAWMKFGSATSFTRGQHEARR